jgi:small subunit ribosomal protein S17
MSETATTTPEVAEGATKARGLRKTRVGEVISDKMDKTIIVKTINRVPHAKFGKIVKQVSKFHVHDEKNEAKIGDQVSIAETRPLSKLKRWRLVEVLKH